MFKQIKIENSVHNVSKATSVSVFTYKIGHASTKVLLLDQAVVNLCATYVNPFFKICVPFIGFCLTGYKSLYNKSFGKAHKMISWLLARSLMQTICTISWRPNLSIYHNERTRWRSWLRHCTSSWKVAVSIPDEGHLINPSGRTLALWSTPPVTETSTRCKGGRCVGLTLPHSCADCLEIMNA